MYALQSPWALRIARAMSEPSKPMELFGLLQQQAQLELADVQGFLLRVISSLVLG